MDWEKVLRRSQSLKSIPSSQDKLIWSDAGLQERTASVSQLVARYQTKVIQDGFGQAAAGHEADRKTKTTSDERTLSPLQGAGSQLEYLLRRNEENERSRARCNLSRSTSTGSLQHGKAGSIEALKALFESKAQSQWKSSFRSAALKLTADMPALNGAASGEQSPVEERKPPAATNPKKTAGDEFVTPKENLVNSIQNERRKPIAGIDFERIAAIDADEKKRSIADFRNSSFIQTKEILSVSVKAMSAIYMSKVANQESIKSPFKVEREQPRESGKRSNSAKMNQDSSDVKDVLPTLPSDEQQAGQQDNSGTHSQQRTPAQLSKEVLHQQRQKSELKRLLKHTHPELNMSDEAVDEEFAEVLNSERETVDEMGYEGEVLSRRLLFENCGLSSGACPHPSETRTMKEKKHDFRSNSFGKPKGECFTESVEGDVWNERSLPDSGGEIKEGMVREDVQAKRKISGDFLNTLSVGENPKHFPKHFELHCGQSLYDNNGSGNTDQEEQPKWSTGHTEEFPDEENSSEEESKSFYGPERNTDVIKTSVALFKNNPFISANIKKENSNELTSRPENQNDAAGVDCLPANVKKRTHLFESLPFDKIRSQNQDEIETQVENIKETLNFLYQVNALHSAGAIIEVSETMKAKKAKFFLSDSGPEINDKEVAEGGAQNFIVQSLPRLNLKPQITYLKENKTGSMEKVVVDVLEYMHEFSTNKDTEFKTANAVQLVEDILNQDNSLRKGVIIQDPVSNCAEVIVYSLYKYINEEEVKSYTPAHRAKYGELEMTLIDNDNRLGLNIDQTLSEPDRTITRGNVKFFKSCIEKGDLTYLKTLQDDDEAAGEDIETCPPRIDLVEESSKECIQVDVKKLTSIFCVNEDLTRANDMQLSDRSCRKSQSFTRSITTKHVNQATEEAAGPQENMDCKEISYEKEEKSVSVISDCIPGHESELQHRKTKEQFMTANSESNQTDKVCSLTSQDWAGIDNQSSTICSTASEISPEQEQEIVFEGKVQAALESLEKSNINVTRGDYSAAMIYRNSQKSPKKMSQNDDVVTVPVQYDEEYRPSPAPQSDPDLEMHDSNLQNPIKDQCEPTAQCITGKSRRPTGPKPPPPPKPEHLKVKQGECHQSPTRNPVGPPVSASRAKETISKPALTHSVGSKEDSQQQWESNNETSDNDMNKPSQAQLLQDTGNCHQAKDLEDDTKKSMKKEGKNEREQNLSQNVPDKDTTNAPDESHVDFREAFEKFGGKNVCLKKTAPVKPKRGKRAKSLDKTNKLVQAHAGALAKVELESVNTNADVGSSGTAADCKEQPVNISEQICKVETREKLGMEVEDEQRQRLSAHMSEIMRGDMTAAMQIFEQLRKQEQLQSILSRVEEIEKDTSEVDVRSLRRVFENVPGWVVADSKKTQKKIKAESKDKPVASQRERNESKSSMEHVFGDLERASEEIINLKEQTLARLKDIEDAIRKALYSVSTLKSDSDIAGLSSLIKESLEKAQGTSSKDIEKSGISSSRMKSVKAQGCCLQQETSEESVQSFPSSPAFISIKSASRNVDEAETVTPDSPICHKCQLSLKMEGKQRTTSLLACNSPKSDPRGGTQIQSSSQQHGELGALEVRTDSGGRSVVGGKNENQDRTDSSAHHLYLTSSVADSHPDTKPSHAVIGPQT